MANQKCSNAKTLKRETLKKSADQRENERILAIAERPMLSDPRSDICNTDYWACKPK